MYDYPEHLQNVRGFSLSLVSYPGDRSKPETGVSCVFL
jgi:hypothetical protein